MKRRFRKSLRKLRAGDSIGAVRALIRPHHTERRIVEARAEVSRYLRNLHDNTVAYGPFKGLILPSSSSWGGHDIAAKILGSYESAVVERISNYAHHDGLLVDIGAADGYFAVGAMKAKLYAQCICFELSEKSRGVLANTAEQNGVSDNIHIYGKASEEAILKRIPAENQGVVLCDIEGAEFELLTSGVLQHLQKMRIIVELHDFMVENGAQLRANLIERASQFYEHEIIESDIPHLSKYQELKKFDDNHRLLAFSEGRDIAMEWLVLHPRERGS